MTNPYRYDDDFDADLFEESKVASNNEKVAGHTVDGSVCEKCRRRHDLTNIPSEIREPLLHLLERMPGHIVAQVFDEEDFKSHHAAKIAHTFLHYNYKINESAFALPVNQAIFHVLDEMTEGRCTLLWKAYEYERQLIVSHLSLKLVNNGLEEARAIELKPPEKADEKFLIKLHRSIHVMGFISEILVERISTLARRYTDSCLRAGLEVDRGVISSGKQPQRESNDLFDAMSREIRGQAEGASLKVKREDDAIQEDSQIPAER